MYISHTGLRTNARRLICVQAYIWAAGNFAKDA